MPHYIAIIEDAGPDHAVGVWFPDLPGCISGGDDVDEALENASEALAFYAQELSADGRELPSPRTLAELEADPEFCGRPQEPHGRPDRMAGPHRRHGVRTVRRTRATLDSSAPNAP